MTQDAVVTKLLPDGMAEVVVERGTACGSNCGNCESCVFQNHIKTPAYNKISAMPGQKVTIETKSSKIYGAIMLVYIMPFVLFFLGYAASAALKMSDGWRIVVSFVFFAIGFAIVVISQKRKKAHEEITFEITQLR